MHSAENTGDGRCLTERPSALLRACWPSSLCWHYLCYARTLARRSCPRRLTGTRHSCDSCVKIARRTAGAQSTSEWLPIDAQWPEASLRPTMPAMIKARPLRRNGSAGSPKAAMPTIPVPAAAKIMPTQTGRPTRTKKGRGASVRQRTSPVFSALCICDFLVVSRAGSTDAARSHVCGRAANLSVTSTA